MLGSRLPIPRIPSDQRSELIWAISTPATRRTTSGMPSRPSNILSGQHVDCGEGLPDFFRFLGNGYNFHFPKFLKGPLFERFGSPAVLGELCARAAPVEKTTQGSILRILCRN